MAGDSDRDLCIRLLFGNAEDDRTGNPFGSGDDAPSPSGETSTAKPNRCRIRGGMRNRGSSVSQPISHEPS